MVPVKNGFWFLYNDGLRNSDLWGCKVCMRYQIHGIPIGPLSKIFGKINNTDDVEMASDPGNSKFWAILKPDLTFTEYFATHMSEWYPEWRFR